MKNCEKCKKQIESKLAIKHIKHDEMKEFCCVKCFQEFYRSKK